MADVSQTEKRFEESLRSQLMGASEPSQLQQPEPPSQSTSGPAPYPVNARSPQSSNGHIDPSIGGGGGGGPSPPGQGQYMGPMVIDDAIAAMGDKGGNNRRELSSTKRAAQNRAAQRAFRQRKEAYISKLEKQVKDYGVMEEDFKALQHENYQLREYILALQTRILDSANELPPPPPRIHLVHPADAQRHQQQQAALAQQRQQEAQQQAQVSTQEGPMEHDHTSPAAATDAQAPTASMTSQRGDDGMSPLAVEQLQAAAAEAGGLGGSKS
ncbi:hypothetical protein CAC42_7226 [Sphaceloma murrayae]|uniref:Putative transcription factor kapC n=1 Tax=Sphaceloma murrayae TaxID=2082308 RepID=A0A2K1QQ73_9PEZI|nr:hypothetical protein CAC42_7226 [Sphaceloma murrayae]